jgi:hypothetical protein
MRNKATSAARVILTMKETKTCQQHRLYAQARQCQCVLEGNNAGKELIQRRSHKNCHGRLEHVHKGMQPLQSVSSRRHNLCV